MQTHQEVLARHFIEAAVRENSRSSAGRSDPFRFDPYHRKRRKIKRGNSTRGYWKKRMREYADANYARIAAVEASLKRGGFRYRDFLVAINRRQKMRLNSMVQWLRQDLPGFEEAVLGKT